MLVQVLDSHLQNQVSNFVTSNYGQLDYAHLVLLDQISQEGPLWSIRFILEKICSVFYVEIKALSFSGKVSMTERVCSRLYLNFGEVYFITYPAKLLSEVL